MNCTVWECKVCGVNNHILIEKCEVCGNKRGTKESDIKQTLDDKVDGWE